MNWKALDESIAQYRAASAAETQELAESAGERAQDYLAAFVVSATGWLALTIFGFIGLRCAADAFGAMLAHETPGLAAWLYADLAQTSQSSGWLALAWTLLGVSLRHGLERVSARMYAGFRNEPVPAWRWPWSR